MWASFVKFFVQWQICFTLVLFATFQRLQLNVSEWTFKALCFYQIATCSTYEFPDNEIIEGSTWNCVGIVEEFIAWTCGAFMPHFTSDSYSGSIEVRSYTPEQIEQLA